MKNLTNRFKEGFSRRRFMKGALLGAGAVAAGSNWNIAEVLAGAKTAVSYTHLTLPTNREL